MRVKKWNEAMRKFLERFDLRKLGTADEVVISFAVVIGVAIWSAIRLSMMLAGGG